MFAILSKPDGPSALHLAVAQLLVLTTFKNTGANLVDRLSETHAEARNNFPAERELHQHQG